MAWRGVAGRGVADESENRHVLCGVKAVRVCGSRHGGVFLLGCASVANNVENARPALAEAALASHRV